MNHTGKPCPNCGNVITKNGRVTCSRACGDVIKSEKLRGLSGAWHGGSYGSKRKWLALKLDYSKGVIHAKG